MAIDPSKMFAAATRADVAQVALSASSAILNIKWALAALSRGEAVDEYLKQIEADSKKLGEAFDELTGWTEE